MSSRRARQRETYGVPVRLRGPAIVGFFGILLFFGGFGVWASTAPLSGAAVAPGIIVARGQNKVVQHLEGGIIKEILVNEGDTVEADQPVFVLDRIAAETTLNRMTEKRDALAADEARLVAEREGKETLEFPALLLDRQSEPMVARLIDDRSAEFAERLKRYHDEVGILAKRRAAFEEDIRGVEAQNQALKEQMELIDTEITGLAELFEKGLATQDRLLALRRSRAALFGEMGQNVSKIASAHQQIAEIEQQISRAGTVRREEASTTLTETRANLQDVENQIRTAKDILDRIVVRAPVTGVVLKLGVHTSGEVIQPGQRLLEIFPRDSELLIEARVRPEDIDAVSVGLQAAVRFSALNRRTTPVVDAEVEYVSADRLVDDKTGQPYYLARLRLADLTGTGIDTGDLYPGMQVETYIRTTERTFVEYLVRPIRDSFQKAFRES